MFKSIAKMTARKKVMARREQIREAIESTYKDDFDVIFQAIHLEQDIIPALPERNIEYLRKNLALASALDDADFLLGLTVEILPEYSDLLENKKPWLQRQLRLRRARVEGR